MQINITLTPEQLLSVSRDLQAALPELLPALIPELISRLLSTAGEAEERRAFEAALPKHMDSWDRQKHMDKHQTFRQAAIKKVAEGAIPLIANDPQVTAISQSLAVYVQEHRKEIAAEAFARWFEGMWARVAKDANENAGRSSALIQALTDRQIIPFDTAQKIMTGYTDHFGLRY